MDFSFILNDCVLDNICHCCQYLFIGNELKRVALYSVGWVNAYPYR